MRPPTPLRRRRRRKNNNNKENQSNEPPQPVSNEEDHLTMAASHPSVHSDIAVPESDPQLLSHPGALHPVYKIVIPAPPPLVTEHFHLHLIHSDWPNGEPLINRVNFLFYFQELPPTLMQAPHSMYAQDYPSGVPLTTVIRNLNPRLRSVVGHVRDIAGYHLLMLNTALVPGMPHSGRAILPNVFFSGSGIRDVSHEEAFANPHHVAVQLRHGITSITVKITTPRDPLFDVQEDTQLSNSFKGVSFPLDAPLHENQTLLRAIQFVP